MQQQRTVAQLAQALTDGERRDLVERIQRSLNLAKKDQAPIYHAPVNQDYRDRMIQHDMQELSFLQRILLWFKRVFGGRNDVDSFLEIKLSGMAKNLEAHHLADATARTLNPAFAESLLRLYARVRELADFFDFLWGSEKNLMNAVHAVLAARIPNAKSAMDDFMTAAEMERIFETVESKAGLRQELLERLNAYLDGIPVDVFTRMEEGLLPLYYFKELATMEFGPLFRAFQADPGAVQRGVKPEFKAAAVDRILDDLEKLYFCIHTALKGGEGDALHQEIFELFKNTPRKRPDDLGGGLADPLLDPGMADLPPPDEAGPVPGTAPQESGKPGGLGADESLMKAAEAHKESGDRNLRRLMKELFREVALFSESTLLAELIRYFRNDPYYKFLAYVPGLNLKEFYYASTRMKILEELDTRYTLLRERIIKRITLQLFQSRYVEFEHYKRSPPNITRNTLPTFRYVDSLCLIYNYTLQIYLPHLKELLKVLTRALPSRSRESQGEFTFHMNGLESIHEQIKLLDHSFAPENAEGKNIIRLRVNMERDPTQDRAYRIYVVQKEKDIKPVLEEGMEHLRALGSLLDEVLKLPEEMINERFQHILGVSTQGGYYNRFVAYARDIKTLYQAVRYQRTLEEERI